MSDRSDSGAPCVRDGEIRERADRDSLRADGGIAPSDGERVSTGQFVALGVAVFGSFAVGLIVMILVYSSLVDSPTLRSQLLVTGVSWKDTLFLSVYSAFGSVLSPGLVIAVGLGLYVPSLADEDRSGPALSAVTAGVGSAVTLGLLLGGMLVLQPDGASLDAIEYGKTGVAGATGIAATAAVAAFTSDALGVR